jgi:hypothetical protein
MATSQGSHGGAGQPEMESTLVNRTTDSSSVGHHYADLGHSAVQQSQWWIVDVPSRRKTLVGREMWAVYATTEHTAYQRVWDELVNQHYVDPEPLQPEPAVSQSNWARHDKNGIYLYATYGDVEDEVTFTILTASNVLVCPDGQRKQLEDCGWISDDKNKIELYAEWNDIGVFYYPNHRDETWVQGQVPTYNNETLDIEVTFE